MTFVGGNSEGITLSDMAERQIQQSPNYEFHNAGMLTFSGEQSRVIYWRLPMRFQGNKVFYPL